MSLAREELLERAREIELLVLDVDGVLTDGGLYYGPEGEALKRFDVKDGHAVVLARRVGLRVAILTARCSKIVQKRGEELGISPISLGSKDKLAGLAALLAEAGVPAERIAYVGDDLNDLGPIGRARLSACPVDAAAEVREAVDYVAQAPGGHGAVREVVELLLKAQGKWDEVLARMRAGGFGRAPDAPPSQQ
jgi:3-deoxy-D-manno-octulosonate 8-phosphate phosphatase (KDO 8-P phosphatase)